MIVSGSHAQTSCLSVLFADFDGIFLFLDIENILDDSVERFIS